MIRLTAHLLLMAMLSVPSALAGNGGETFSCTGPFGRDASHSSLINEFGAANVSREEVFRSGDTVPMTVVFPKDPDRRVMVHWLDEEGRRGLDFVVVQSPAWNVAGTTVGMSAVEVQHLNGRPFKLMDFPGGDNDGAVLDWQGGKLDGPQPGGCRIGAVFGINNTDIDQAQEAPHDGGVLSEDPALRTADARLYELTVYFPKAGGRP
jgi:hypothetical protein